MALSRPIVYLFVFDLIMGFTLLLIFICHYSVTYISSNFYWGFYLALSVISLLGLFVANTGSEKYFRAHLQFTIGAVISAILLLINNSLFVEYHHSLVDMKISNINSITVLNYLHLLVANLPFIITFIVFLCSGFLVMCVDLKEKGYSAVNSDG